MTIDRKDFNCVTGGFQADRRAFGAEALDLMRDAFLFDFDGTLADIAGRPDDVVVPLSTRDDLRCLSRLTGGAVAVVSGRSIAALDVFLHPWRFPAAGIHGLQIRLRVDAETSMPAVATVLETHAAAMRLFAQTHRGVLLEDKGLALALHCRQRPELEDAAFALVEALAASAPGVLVAQRGKCVAELRVAGSDKGNAVLQLMQEPGFAGRRPIFFGDDLTDEPAFDVVRAMGGLGVFIGTPTRFTNASASLHAPASVRLLLALLAGRAQGDGPSGCETRKASACP